MPQAKNACLFAAALRKTTRRSASWTRRKKRQDVQATVYHDGTLRHKHLKRISAVYSFLSPSFGEPGRNTQTCADQASSAPDDPNAASRCRQVRWRLANNSTISQIICVIAQFLFGAAAVDDASAPTHVIRAAVGNHVRFKLNRFQNKSHHIHHCKLHSVSKCLRDGPYDVYPEAKLLNPTLLCRAPALQGVALAPRTTIACDMAGNENDGGSEDYEVWVGGHRAFDAVCGHGEPLMRLRATSCKPPACRE